MTHLQRPGRRLLFGTMGLVVLSTIGLTLLLAVSPPYDGVGNGFVFATLWLPLQTTVFRRAVVNTLVLAVGVGSVSLVLGLLWAKVGVPNSAAGRSLLLLPVCVSGAVAGLIWRPWLAPGLVMAQAELNLALTGVVFVWMATPAVAGWLAWRGADRRALLYAALIPLLLVLLDDGLPLTLTGGEPFNAAHTWASWSQQMLWVTRNWGEAAVMRLGLGALVGLLVGLTWLVARRYPSAAQARRTSPFGLLIALVWSVGPFIGGLPRLVDVPVAAWAHLWQLGLLLWLLWWGVVIAGVGVSAAFLLRHVPVAGPRWTALGVALTALWPVALAYLRQRLPWIGFAPWLVVPFAVTATLIGMGLSPVARTLRVLALMALLLMAHGFGLALVLDAPVGWTLPAIGISRYLATGVPSALAWALLLDGAVVFVVVWTLLRSIDVDL